MHPILLSKLRLGVYLLSWTPGAVALAFLLTREAHFDWTRSVLTAAGLVFFYALVCLSPWYSCRYLPLQPSTIPKLLLNHTVAALVAAALAAGAAKLAGVPAPQLTLLFATATLLYLLAVALHYVFLSFQSSREAETREQMFREADEAIYARRNSAVEQERAIKENELNTEIAIETKKRQIRETQMDAERAVQEKEGLLKKEALESNIGLEDRRKSLVALAADNSKAEADARAYGVSSTMKALGSADAKILQALASTGMRPEQLIAFAFQELASKADKIGQLNISPDLLRELLTPQPARK